MLSYVHDIKQPRKERKCMRKVFKYNIELTDFQKIKLPRLAGADCFKDQFLKLDLQNGRPCIWCLVDDDEEEYEVIIRTVGTGEEMTLLSKDNYLDSYMLRNGELVFHIFYEE